MSDQQTPPDAESTTKKFVAFLIASNVLFAVVIVFLEFRAVLLSAMDPGEVATLSIVSDPPPPVAKEAPAKPDGVIVAQAAIDVSLAKDADAAHDDGTGANPPGNDLLAALRVVASDALRRGREDFKKCALCHSIDDDLARYGPHLICVPGRPIASVATTYGRYRYSKSMVEFARHQHRWSLYDLRGFVGYPQDHVSNSRMPFRGLRGNDALLKSVLQYLYLSCVMNFENTVSGFQVVQLADETCARQSFADWFTALMPEPTSEVALSAFQKDPKLLLIASGGDLPPLAESCNHWTERPWSGKAAN